MRAVHDWVIDCDTHITEPGDVWTARLPARFQALRGLDDWRAGSAPIFSIVCGDQKIPRAPRQPGGGARPPCPPAGDTAEASCGDVCVVWEGGIETLLALLARAGVKPIDGPVPRMGGRGGATTVGVSVYVRDPDRNLLEFISYDEDDVAAHREAGPVR
jgi:catechol 2,3-dioxygenase-like lactoylglutathione lyase family enzyme